MQIKTRKLARCQAVPSFNAPVSRESQPYQPDPALANPNPRLSLTLRRAQIQPCWPHRLAHRPDNHATFLGPSLQSHGVLLCNLSTCRSRCPTKPLRPSPGYGRAAVSRPHPLHQRQPPLCLASRLGHRGISGESLAAAAAAAVECECSVWCAREGASAATAGSSPTRYASRGPAVACDTVFVFHGRRKRRSNLPPGEGRSSGRCCAEH